MSAPVPGSRRAARDAERAYFVMLAVERANPDLATNSYWQSLVDTARARQQSTFEALQR